MQFDDSTLTCARVRDRIDEFVDGVDGGLAPGEWAAIEAHVSACDACRREVTAARALLAELRAFPVLEAPASVVAAAAATIASARRVIPMQRPAARSHGALRWIPAVAAAAIVVALVATARWSGPITTAGSGFAEARVERAARETVFALSYVNRYARMTGEIVTDEALGSVERAIDAGAIERGLSPSLRRAMEKSGLIETKPAHEHS